jgi:hypothetical protein
MKPVSNLKLIRKWKKINLKMCLGSGKWMELAQDHFQLAVLNLGVLLSELCKVSKKESVKNMFRGRWRITVSDGITVTLADSCVSLSPRLQGKVL